MCALPVWAVGGPSLTATDSHLDPLGMEVGLKRGESDGVWGDDQLDAIAT
jgi:hypothetical protein